MKWEILNKNNKNIKNTSEIVDVLLENRGIKTEKDKNEFFDPINPLNIPLKSLNVNESDIKKAIDRIKKAKKNAEDVIVYGDYDADGITATAIMWEALHSFGLDVLPYIPDRFADGYGIKPETVKELKVKNEKLKLIVTVDNGIVGYEGIKAANDLGIDVIVVDHHVKTEKNNLAFAIIHSTLVCGSALSWFFAKELGIDSGLELAAIGTIADQMPLIGINRSIAKYGLEGLSKTRRPGLKALFEEAGLTTAGILIKPIGTYEVNYIIAPRINAMGRLKHGLESLRLLCTKDKNKAFDIAKNISNTNLERQKKVEEVVSTALSEASESKGKVIVIFGEGYHEGVIGLAAGRLVEVFYRPVIVLSVKGETAKASARSISGFNIIEAIRAVNLHSEGGGHPMAAGFSIETSKIEKFIKEINKFADKLLTDEILEKKMKIDCQVTFDLLDYKLLTELNKFDPTGLGNLGPSFATKGVTVVEAKLVGRESGHVKLKLKQNEHFFDSIFFGGGKMYSDLTPEAKIDVVYSLEDNSWNGYKNLQLKIKDIKVI